MLGGLGPDEDIPPVLMTFNLSSLTSLVLGSQGMALRFTCSHSSNSLGQLRTYKVEVGHFGPKAKMIRPIKMWKLFKLFLQPNP
jgi:hypothetical protein